MKSMENFGIELEFTGVERRVVANAIANMFGTTFETEINEALDEPYMFYKVTDDNGQVWQIIRDRSVKAQCIIGDSIVDINDNEHMFRNELVSPVLNSDSIHNLFKIMDVIKALGGITNSSCGIHIHIDKMRFDDAFDLFNRFVNEQDKIFNFFDVEPWRRENYCRLYTDKDIPECKSYEEFMQYIHKTYASPDDKSKAIKDSRSLRYFGLNFWSLYNHGTIEYRLFNASLDKTNLAGILKWVLDFSYPYSKGNTMKDVIELVCLMEIV